MDKRIVLNDDSLEKSDSLFDGDPNVSGSTEHIGAIMKSIADGDANTLASLAITFRLKRSPEGHLKSQIPLWSVQAFRTYT